MNHIFDLDCTFFKSNASFAFYRALLKERVIPLRTIPRVLQIYLRFFLGFLDLEGFHHAIFHSVLKGLKFSDLEMAADRFLLTCEKRVCPIMNQVLHHAKASHHKTYLLSSSPDFLVSRIAKRFSFDHSLGTQYLIDKEGRLCDIFLLITGQKKKQLAGHWVGDGNGTIAYSDSFEDVSLLEWVDHPITIRPDRKLRKHALRLGWCNMTQKTKITPELFSPKRSNPKFILGERVFDLKMQKTYLSEKIVVHLEEVRRGQSRLNPSFADDIAEGLKQWAREKGATHFAHWFQPLRDNGAEKHDSFLNRNREGQIVELLSGKDLLFGEPDGSSFPTGGLRVTHEARGITAWDPLSFPFLWEAADGLTLCIPAVFYSWKGFALDHKLPLLRSNQKIEMAIQRLLSFCQMPVEKGFATVGIEQEFFLLDEALVQMRPDLVLTGRTLFGAKPAKGQELEDHYCAVVQPPILECMRDFEVAALRIGIPLKTRHCEVAPKQYEVAPLFEEAHVACDHNLQLMEVMRQSAEKLGLRCLFHEKPFMGLNGSGKHINWSLGTESGLNLLDPKENSLLFLITLAAIVSAVHVHAGLLRASIGSASNDHRLGGSEAPPSILSVFLGDALENLIQEILHDKPIEPTKLRTIDLGLVHLPIQPADLSDRNRTSFFVFTSNKFEFRAVGASSVPAFPVTILNAIVADRLHLILDEIEEGGKATPLEKALPILKKHFKAALPVIFGGNNYSQEWHQEAEKRELPNFSSSFHAFHALQDKKSIRALQNVFEEKELESRFVLLVEEYAKTVSIESNLMLELFTTQIVPAVQNDLRKRLELLQSASAFGMASEPQMKLAQTMSHLLDEALGIAEEIRALKIQSQEFGWEGKAKVYAELIVPKMQHLRKVVDTLELQTDHTLWPLLKIRELLF